MPKKKNAGCECCGGDTCGELCDPAHPAPDAYNLDVPDTLFATGGAGEAGGDCSETQCDVRSGIWPLTKVAYNATYDCNGTPEPYVALEEPACLWVSEGTLACQRYNDLFGPVIQEGYFVWVVFIDRESIGDYVNAWLYFLCEGSEIIYGFRSALQTAGSVNCSGPIELLRHSPYDSGIGNDSCVINDAITLSLESAP